MPGKIPQHFIDDIITRTDIVDVIDSRVPLKKAGKEYKACCPFHEERTPSFTVSAEKQFYHCFGCGAHGTALGFLMEYEHMEFVEAVEHLASRHGLEVPREEGPTRGQAGPERSVDLLEIVDNADRFYREQLRHHPQAERAVTYLKKRGLTGEIAARFGLGYAPYSWDALLRAQGKTRSVQHSMHKAGLLSQRDDGGYYDRFRNRVMFPIHDHRGRIVGFGGRVLGDGEPKYLNSPETPLFHKGSELYGLHLARGAIRARDRAIVVEGYMDVVALAQHGLDFSVATLGTATTTAHLDRLFRYCAEIVFCFDGDRAGRAAAWKALETTLGALQDGRQASFLFLPEGHDPDSLVRSEGQSGFEKRLMAAISLPDYLIGHLTEQVDLGRLDGRARLVELARPLLARMQRGILRELIIERLAALAHTDRSVLAETLTEPARDAKRRRHSPVRSDLAARPKSAVGLALTLLLQHPSLARIAGAVEDLEASELPGAEIVTAIVAMVREHPGLTTAAILERFRDSRYFERLAELARTEQLMNESAMEQDFHAQIENIRREIETAELNRLLEREKTSPKSLDAASKDRLKELLSRGARTQKPSFPA